MPIEPGNSWSSAKPMFVGYQMHRSCHHLHRVFTVRSLNDRSYFHGMPVDSAGKFDAG